MGDKSGAPMFPSPCGGFGISYRQWLIGKVLPEVLHAMCGQGEIAADIPKITLGIVDAVIAEERKTRYDN